jgi:hypothetical protein
MVGFSGPGSVVLDGGWSERWLETVQGGRVIYSNAKLFVLDRVDSGSHSPGSGIGVSVNSDSWRLRVAENSW